MGRLLLNKAIRYDITGCLVLGSHASLDQSNLIYQETASRRRSMLLGSHTVPVVQHLLDVET